jgi:glycosyltransferase involved in cell wall biosynthesis
MILIDAVYIHESGGKILLEYFINKLGIKKNRYILLLDKRLSSSYIKDTQPDSIAINPNERERSKYYNRLNENVDTIFCFANVPPPKVKDSIKVYILFHNALILSSLFEDNGYSLKNRLSFFAKRKYIYLRNRKVYNWIVQTKSVKNKLSKQLDISKNNIHLLPFYDEESMTSEQLNTRNSDFVYIADSVPQKNHLVLLKAWEILYNQYDCNVTLHLTVPKDSLYLESLIRKLNDTGMLIVNHGHSDKEEVKNLYINSKYMIFPSLAESFGLPLLEGVKCGCKVLGSDLPYIYDVIKPSAVFNPYSPESIAKVVFKSIREEGIPDSTIVIENKIYKLIKLVTK